MDFERKFVKWMVKGWLLSEILLIITTFGRGSLLDIFVLIANTLYGLGYITVKMIKQKR